MLWRFRRAPATSYPGKEREAPFNNNIAAVEQTRIGFNIRFEPFISVARATDRLDVRPGVENKRSFRAFWQRIALGTVIQTRDASDLFAERRERGSLLAEHTI